MSVARSNFLNRIAIFKRVLSSDSLRDNGVAASPHNEKARILRNGISIIAFTILEDFIKDRTGEILQKLGTATFAFNQLSAETQESTTFHALKSIYERALNLKRSNEDWLTFIQNETAHIASTANLPFSISKFSLGWDKSNLAKDDIHKFMKSFGVSGGWNSIYEVTVKANSALISPDTFFTNAASRRHKAAHNPNANSLYADLIDFSNTVKVFALSYDALISKGVINILTKKTANVSHVDISFRFLLKDSGLWKEYKANSTKIIRSDNNYHRILAKTKFRADKKNEFLIIKQAGGEIHNWFIK